MQNQDRDFAIDAGNKTKKSIGIFKYILFQALNKCKNPTPETDFPFFDRFKILIGQWMHFVKLSPIAAADRMVGWHKLVVIITGKWWPMPK